MCIVGGIVQSFYLNDIFLSILADDARSGKSPFCKCRSDTLPSSDKPQECACSIHVSPGHLQSPEIFLCQDPPLIQFHRKSYRRSRRDGVHAEIVDISIQHGNFLDAVHPQVGAHQANRLVLGTLDVDIVLLRIRVGGTAQWTRIAALVPHIDLLSHVLAIDAVLLGILRMLEVVDRDDSDAVTPVRDIRRAILGEGREEGSILDVVNDGRRVLLKTFDVGDRDWLRSTHSDCLELLRAQDRRDSPPACLTSHVMRNACELYQILAGGANSRNLEVLPEIALQGVLSVDGALAPIAGSVTYLDLVVFDTEVHRGLRSALKDDHV